MYASAKLGGSHGPTGPNGGGRALRVPSATQALPHWWAPRSPSSSPSGTTPGDDPHDRLGTESLCLFDQHLSDGRVLLAGDERNARLRDAGLFERDGRQITAQVVGVLERDLGHDARQRREHVRAVEPAAQPDFDDGDVDVPGGQVREGDRGHRLEEAGLGALDVRVRASRSTRRTPSSLIGSPLTRTRSRTDTRCGEVYRPTRKPRARSAATRKAQVDPFPFVPPT